MSSDWAPGLRSLFRKFGNRKHPLKYSNPYQLVVVVVLSSRTTDDLVNKISPGFFQQFPSIRHLAKAKPEDLYPLLSSVTGFAKKASWLVAFAQQVKEDQNIPVTMGGLTKLKGIGRKSANVIMGEMGVPMEGVIVDLHVLRVAPRLGIATGTDAEKIEKQLMETVPQKYWRQLGISLTFLGREICRPAPKCPQCPVNRACEYYRESGSIL